MSGFSKVEMSAFAESFMLSIPNGWESSVSRTGSITVQEIERAEVIKAYANGEIKAGVAALRLQVGTRQVRRLKEIFAEAGLAGMVSARFGMPSNNRLAPGLAQKALQIVRTHYADFSPTFACEQLRDRHGLVLSKETLRRLMTEAGLWIPRSARRAALHQPRERRACLGELVQIDGSRHPWFEKRGAECTLLVYVDDATGRILQLHFAQSESTSSYFEATRRYVERLGTPRAFYADRAAVFRSAAANCRAPTQFQRALNELGIELICANSPQAKGRVERMNRTLQDRLVKELRMDGINSIEAANAWCDQFVERYNRLFSCAPRSELDLHLPLRPTDDLARILATRETRKLSVKLTVQHGDLRYLLKDAPEHRALIGQTITIHTYADGSVELRANGRVLSYAVLTLPRPSPPIDVDSKTLPNEMDKLELKTKRRDNHYRADRPATVVAQGVIAAKKKSAQKRVRST
jgi:transposase InsO family protein